MRSLLLVSLTTTLLFVLLGASSSTIAFVSNARSSRTRPNTVTSFDVSAATSHGGDASQSSYTTTTTTGSSLALVGGGGFDGQPPPQQDEAYMRSLQYGLHVITSPQDFLDFLSVDDRLCVIFVRANWCQLCKGFTVKWRKLCHSLADKYDPTTRERVVVGSVRFAEIEYTEHEDLCKRLKASRLPHVLFYSGSKGMAGKIVQYQCGPSAFGLVVESVDYILGGNYEVQPPWVEFVAAQEALVKAKGGEE